MKIRHAYLLALVCGVYGATGAPVRLADADHVAAFIQFLDRVTDFTFKYAVYVEYKLPAFSGDGGPVELLTQVYEDVLMQDQRVQHIPVEWREASGVVPKYNKTAVHEIAMLRTGRFEKKIGNAFPRPYNQYVGTLWTYTTLLAQIASNPDPGRFNQTSAQLVRLYFDSAKGFEAIADKLFGDEFVTDSDNTDEGDPGLKATHDILRYYPKLITEALLKGSHVPFETAESFGSGGAKQEVEVNAVGSSATVSAIDAQSRQTRLEALAHERRVKTRAAAAPPDAPPGDP
jgi:hypothetical protein